MRASALFRSRRIRAFLAENVRGAWHHNDATVEAYASDHSVFHLRPEAVVVPRDHEDLAGVLELGREEGLSITPRGGGSSTGGASVGSGIVVDMRGEEFSRARVTDSARGPLVVAGPGVRHDTVQRLFAERGFCLPSDPSSGPLSYIGGNVSTKASGAHALRHGAIDRYLTAVEVMLPDGRLVNDSTSLPILEETAWLEGNRESLAHPGLQKCASGYNLRGLAAARDASERLAAVVCGAVGTLGIVTEAVLRGEPEVPSRALCVLNFPTTKAAVDTVPEILEFDPAAIELLDEGCSALMPPGVFAEATGGAMLVVELEGDSPGERARRAAKSVDSNRYWVWQGEADQGTIDSFWKGRKRMLFSVKRNAGGDGAPSLINDIGVSVPSLGRFVEDVSRLVGSFVPRLYVYGHAGSGNLHLRPDVRMLSPKRQVEMSRAVYELVLAYNGTVTAEHGMGRLRAPWLRREWGPEAYEYMRSIKQAIDPEGLMNPETMFTDLSFEEMMDRASLG